MTISDVTAPETPLVYANDRFLELTAYDEDGTGFGPMICKQVADAHGWEIAVTETAAGGARFEVTGVDVVE